MIPCQEGPLAQLVAHLHDAQGVRGSSPLRPTPRKWLLGNDRGVEEVTLDSINGRSLTLRRDLARTLSAFGGLYEPFDPSGSCHNQSLGPGSRAGSFRT